MSVFTKVYRSSCRRKFLGSFVSSIIYIDPFQQNKFYKSIIHHIRTHPYREFLLFSHNFRLPNMPLTKNSDIDKLLHFLHIAILVFLNQGSSSFSDAFTEEPWSWGLTLPISLYFKFALEIHAHLGLCVGIGLPSLVYWGITRNSIDWYADAVLEFNLEFLKTGLFNLVIGFAHWLILKLLHKFHESGMQNKRLSNCWPILSKLEKSDILQHPLLRPIGGQQMFLQLLELLSVFFYNGNVMLLCWGFSGNKYDSDIGKAISWVSLGSSLHVWMKACLKVLEGKAATPLADEEKACQMAGKGEEPSNQSKDQLQVVTLETC